MYINCKPTNWHFMLTPAVLSFLLERNYAYFSYGRFALKYALEVLGIQRGENVLLPAYICDAVIPPFSSQGIEVRYFDVNPDLSPNFEIAESLIDSKTRAMLIVHYLGFPQSVLRIMDFCQKNRLFLIEDCAHTLGGKFQNRYLGTFGDAAIFSPWKFLAITSGGILSLSRKYGLLEPVGDHRIFDFRAMLRLCLEEISFCIGSDALLKVSQAFAHKIRSGRKSLETEEMDSQITAIPQFNKWLLDRVNLQQLIKKRRENYLYLGNLIRNLPSVQPVFNSLPEGVVPLAFPILVESPLAEKLRPLTGKFGFYFWPQLPRFADPRGYKNALYFAQRTLLLPIHQRLRHSHLEFIINILTKVNTGK